MVTFPAWVSGPRKKRAITVAGQAAIASRRLRYLIMRAAVETTEAGSIASLSDFCMVARTDVHAAIRAGHFSTKLATRIETACGRDIIRRDWLVFPCDIEDDKNA